MKEPWASAQYSAEAGYGGCDVLRAIPLKDGEIVEIKWLDGSTSGLFTVYTRVLHKENGHEVRGAFVDIPGQDSREKLTLRLVEKIIEVRRVNPYEPVEVTVEVDPEGENPVDDNWTDDILIFQEDAPAVPKQSVVVEPLSVVQPVVQPVIVTKPKPVPVKIGGLGGI